MSLVIGIDLDNTIACYDEVFHAAALERGLVPAGLRPPTKRVVRDFLRARGQEEAWTELQGHVYGSRMDLARPFAGAIPFVTRALGRGTPVYIVSHRTRHPYRGPTVDLHASALGWLESRGFFRPDSVGLPPAHVFLRETLREKVEVIAALECTHFVDDHPDVFLDGGFPGGCRKLLFRPDEASAGETVPDGIALFRSWGEVESFFEDLPRSAARR